MKSTDPQKLAEHLRKGPKFDVMKAREAYFRAYDNQMIMEMYAVRAKDPAKMKDQWDIYDALGAVPVRTRTWKRSPRRKTASARSADPFELDCVIVDGSAASAMTLDFFGDRVIRVQFVFILEQVLNGLLVGAYYLLSRSAFR